MTLAFAAAQAEFSEHHEAEVGNEAIVKGLVEMRKYWDALEGDFRVEETGAEGLEDEKKGRTHLPNHGVQITGPSHDSASCLLARPTLTMECLWENGIVAKSHRYVECVALAAASWGRCCTYVLEPMLSQHPSCVHPWHQRSIHLCLGRACVML